MLVESYHIPQEQAERDVVIWADALKNVQPYLIDITMDIILDQPEQMLFALLRSALNSTKPVSEILLPIYLLPFGRRVTN